MNSQDDLRHRYPMDRRIFVSMVAAGAASALFQGTTAAAQPAPKARNVVRRSGGNPMYTRFHAVVQSASSR